MFDLSTSCLICVLTMQAFGFGDPIVQKALWSNQQSGALKSAGETLSHQAPSGCYTLLSLEGV